MPYSRRTAREMALRVLFQVDVGRQPLAEVLAETTTQALIEVTNPVHQVILDAQKAVSQATVEAAPSGATTAGRRIRNAGRMVAQSLKALEECLAEKANDSSFRKGEFTSEHALINADTCLEETSSNLKHIIDRYESESRAIGAIVGATDPFLSRLREVYSFHAPAARDSVMMMSKLAHGVMANTKAVDRQISELSEGWSVGRQPAVDRNILRLAAFELSNFEDIDARVTIHEAVELANTFSTEEGARFINGVLNALAEKLGKCCESGITPVEQTHG